MRKAVDCRDTPSEVPCTLTISGEEEEVLEAAVQHTVSRHGHEDSPLLREMIRIGMKDERELYEGFEATRERPKSEEPYITS